MTRQTNERVKILSEARVRAGLGASSNLLVMSRDSSLHRRLGPKPLTNARCNEPVLDRSSPRQHSRTGSEIARRASRQFHKPRPRKPDSLRARRDQEGQNLPSLASSRSSATSRTDVYGRALADVKTPPQRMRGEAHGGGTATHMDARRSTAISSGIVVILVCGNAKLRGSRKSVPANDANVRIVLAGEGDALELPNRRRALRFRPARHSTTSTTRVLVAVVGQAQYTTRRCAKMFSLGSEGIVGEIAQIHGIPRLFCSLSP